MDMEQLINEVVKNVCAVLNEGPPGKSCESKASGLSGSSPACSDGGAKACASETGNPGDVIREKLVTEKMAKELINDCSCGTLRFAKGTIITPAAKDIFKAGHKKIEIV